MDPPGVAPGSPACDAGVFLLDDEPVLSPKVHVSDLSARHAPKDLNPDQLGWNQSCCRYTRDTHLIVSGSRETRTHKSRSRPPVFKTGSSSGRMTSVCKLRGLESNQRPPGSEPGVTTNSNYPASFVNPRHSVDQGSQLEDSGGGIEPAPAELQSQASLPADYPASERVPCGNRTRLASLEGWSLCRSAKGTCCKAEGEGVEPSRLSRSTAFERGCHRQLACPSVKLRRQESNLRHDG